MRWIPVVLFMGLTVSAKAQSPSEIVTHAPDTAWQSVPAEQLMLMTLAGGRRVVIELAPDFAPVHAANVVRLAHSHAWDGGMIMRVQENYVVQWQVHDEKAPLPNGFVENPPAEYDRSLAGLAFQPLKYPDPYAAQVGFADGWAVGSDGVQAWPAQCYGMIGVARDMPPNTGNGQELYVVNSEAPRQLDRNLAVVGRVLEGMEFLNALPRGTGPLGFYTNARENVVIKNVRLAADLPLKQRPTLQTMRTDSASFVAYVAARAARTDPFFVHAAHGVALCNVPVPVREVR